VVDCESGGDDDELSCVINVRKTSQNHEAGKMNQEVDYEGRVHDSDDARTLSRRLSFRSGCLIHNGFKQCHRFSE